MSQPSRLSRDAEPRRPIRRLIQFIADGESNSVAARENLRKLCEAEPDYEFEVQLVNVLNDCLTAVEHGVLVTPCLIRLEPPPPVMIVGTLRDADKVRAALRLEME